MGDTLVVAGCDEATHSGCVKPSGLRLIDTRTWFSRTLDAHASWFKRAGRHIVVERDGLRVYTTDGFLRIHAFKGRAVAAQVSAIARVRAHHRGHRQRHPGDRPPHRQDADAPGAGPVPAVRWPLFATVALVACRKQSSRRPRRPTPGPHWPGPVAFAAERDGSLDIFVRDGDRTRRLTSGQARRVLAELVEETGSPTA